MESMQNSYEGKSNKEALETQRKKYILKEISGFNRMRFIKEAYLIIRDNIRSGKWNKNDNRSNIECVEEMKSKIADLIIEKLSEKHKITGKSEKALEQFNSEYPREIIKEVLEDCIVTNDSGDKVEVRIEIDGKLILEMEYKKAFEG